ncbi:MAG: GntR family transcriptional regulator [Desulfobacterales bacterium]|nr:GntR family transcriptional regulator [Desulfobacterales bacterium]
MKMRLQNNFQLLRSQVYEHLRTALRYQSLKPGMFVTINQLSKELDINRTPLRDALLQLQVEGFVTFLPQRGIMINELSRQDREDIYQMLGALDSSVLASVFPRLTPDHVQQMRSLNHEMYDTCTSPEDRNTYFDLNARFHGVYLNLSDNQLLLNQLDILRQRLFDFGAQGSWIQKVRELNHQEHIQLMELMEDGQAHGAAAFIRDTHCVMNWDPE